MRDTIRVSELALWMRCRRRTYLQYEMNYDSTNREAGIGTLFHAMLAHYYLGRVVDASTDLPFLEEAEDNAIAWAMYNTYVVEAEGEGLDVGQSTVAVEERFETEIGGLTLSGGIDHIFEDPIVGGLVIQDHKTVKSFFSTAQRDFQLMTYAVLAREAGHNVKAIEHNMIKRNKRTAQAKPPFIQRNRILVSDAELDSWSDMLAYLVRDYANVMKIAEDSGLGVKHPMLWAKGTNDCSWYCPFASICGMVDDPAADVASALQMEFVQREEAPQ